MGDAHAGKKQGVAYRQWKVENVEPWADAAEGAAVLNEMAELIAKHVVLPPGSADALALWVLHTYAFELREVSTYLAIESPEKGCGKTTLLMVLSELVNRPVMAANISQPAFFRVIEETRPTLLIDEADTFLQGNDELRGILNSGYTRKAAYVVRVSSYLDGPRGNGPEEEGRSALAKFSTWCPKAVAAIGSLPDTLQDRCIVIRMQRKLVTEGCERVRDMQVGQLKRMCVRWVQDHRGEIVAATPGIPAGLNNRAADIWEPLLVLADLAGEGWPERARGAAEALTTSAQENNPIGSLLLDILLVFAGAKSDRILSRVLARELSGFSNRPWTELCKGKAVTEPWLAQRLRPYGVRPRTLRVGEERGKGYYMEDFGDTFRRYIVRSELKELTGVYGAEGGGAGSEKAGG